MRPEDMKTFGDVVAQKMQEIVKYYETTNEPRMKAMQGKIDEQAETITNLTRSIEALIERKPVDGKDADEEAITARVLAAIPEPVAGKDADDVDVDAIVVTVVGHFTPLFDKLALDVIDVIPEPIKGDKGDKGDTPPKVDMDEVVAALMTDERFCKAFEAALPEPVKGDKGDSVTIDEVYAILSADVKTIVEAQLPDLIPEPVAGKDADEEAIFERLVKVIPEPVAGKDAEVDYDKIANRVEREVKDAVKDLKLPEPTKLQIKGALELLWPTIRGDILKSLPKIGHKGTWTPDTQYDVGDEVIKNGSTYRMIEPTSDAPPSESWQMIAQGKAGKQGKPGADGKRGGVGPSGNGIKDMTIAENMLVIELEDGTIITRDMTDFIGLIIKSIGEV